MSGFTEREGRIVYLNKGILNTSWITWAEEAIPERHCGHDAKYYRSWHIGRHLGRPYFRLYEFNPKGKWFAEVEETDEWIWGLEWQPRQIFWECSKDVRSFEEGEEEAVRLLAECRYGRPLEPFLRPLKTERRNWRQWAEDKVLRWVHSP